MGAVILLVVFVFSDDVRRNWCSGLFHMEESLDWSAHRPYCEFEIVVYVSFR